MRTWKEKLSERGANLFMSSLMALCFGGFALDAMGKNHPVLARVTASLTVLMILNIVTLCWRTLRTPPSREEILWYLADKIERTNLDYDFWPTITFTKEECDFPGTFHAWTFQGVMILVTDNHHLYIYGDKSTMTSDTAAIRDRVKEFADRHLNIEILDRIYPMICHINTDADTFNPKLLAFGDGSDEVQREASIKILEELDKYLHRRIHLSNEHDKSRDYLISNLADDFKVAKFMD